MADSVMFPSDAAQVVELPLVLLGTISDSCPEVHGPDGDFGCCMAPLIVMPLLDSRATWHEPTAMPPPPRTKGVGVAGVPEVQLAMIKVPALVAFASSFRTDPVVAAEPVQFVETS